MNVKKCSRCGEVKPLSEYYRRKAASDGLDYSCRLCRKKEQSAYREANRDRLSAAERAWRAANREQHRAKVKAWKQENSQKLAAQKRRYSQSHPDIKSAQRHRRRTKISGNGVYRVTEQEMKRLYASCCAACGSTENIEADHIIPINRGGQHSIGNLQPLCRSCNASKSDRLLVEWRHAAMQPLAA